MTLSVEIEFPGKSDHQDFLAIARVDGSIMATTSGPTFLDAVQAMRDDQASPIQLSETAQSQALLELITLDYD